MRKNDAPSLEKCQRLSIFLQSPGARDTHEALERHTGAFYGTARKSFARGDHNVVTDFVISASVS